MTSPRRNLRADVHDFWHLKPETGAHRVAFRAGASVLVPLLTVIAIGHPGWSPYAAFGALTSLYGRNHVHMSRLAMQASAGTAFTVSVGLGALVSAAGSPGWPTVSGSALVAGVGAHVSSVEDWHPPGPVFLIFGFAAVASSPGRLSDVPSALVVAASSAAFSVIVGNIGAFARRQHHQEVRPRPARTWQPQFGAHIVEPQVDSDADKGRGPGS